MTPMLMMRFSGHRPAGRACSLEAIRPALGAWRDVWDWFRMLETSYLMGKATGPRRVTAS